MSDVAVANTTAGMSGKTVVMADVDTTITANTTFNRSPSAPFTVASGSASVTNLDADKLDGHDSAEFIQFADGTATDGQVLIGKTSDHTWNRATLTAGNGITISNGAGAITVASTAATRLLHQGSGTDTTATATIVDSFSINGLTTKDTIIVYYQCESITQQTANIELYQSTDPVSVVSISGAAALAAGATLIGHAMFAPRQGSSTNLQAFAEGINNSSARLDKWNNPNFTTAWTGTWALALRHNGVTSGGTFKFVWAVFIVSGQ